MTSAYEALDDNLYDTAEIPFYSTSSFRETNKVVDESTGQTIYIKSSSNDSLFDVSELRLKLAFLKENSHVKIRKLSGQLKDDFDWLAQQIALFYDTDDYNFIYSEIQNYFNPNDTYYPGTIGAYCGGCLNKDKGSFDSRGCTIICAGSIPPPYGEHDWDFCNELVIYASYDSVTGFEFVNHNEIEQPFDGKAIIFVEFNSYNTFPGFSDKEKYLLSNSGITSVKLVYYNPDNCSSKYLELTNGFVALAEIKVRGEHHQDCFTQTKNEWVWWMAIIVIFFLIVLLAFLSQCRFWQ